MPYVLVYFSYPNKYQPPPSPLISHPIIPIVPIVSAYPLFYLHLFPFLTSEPLPLCLCNSWLIISKITHFLKLFSLPEDSASPGAP